MREWNLSNILARTVIDLDVQILEVISVRTRVKEMATALCCCIQNMRHPQLLEQLLTRVYANV